LAGNRPYWVDSRVRQFPHTCESGYGMPSGHCMVSVAALFYLIFAYGSTYQRLLSPLGLVITAAICISRIHTGSHFPSQVVAGTALGFYLAIVASKKCRLRGWMSKLDLQSPRRIMLIAFCGGFACFILILAELSILRAFDVDPLSSLNKAREGCHSLEAVKRTTSPMKSVARNAGICIGSGFGIALRKMQTKRGSSSAFRNLGRLSYLQILEIVVGILMMKLADTFLLQNEKHAGDYDVPYSFSHFTVLFLFATWMIPSIMEATIGSHWCVSKVAKYC